MSVQAKPKLTPTWNYEAAFARHEGLLTASEQERLRNSRVAIVGMGGVGGVHLITLGRLGSKVSLSEQRGPSRPLPVLRQCGGR